MKKHYFDSKQVEEWILEWQEIMKPYDAKRKKAFQEFVKTLPKDDSNFQKRKKFQAQYSHSFTPEDESRLNYLGNIISKQLAKIVHGIIWTHRYTRFEPYDDLFSHAMEASWSSVARYNPNIEVKNSDRQCFNYFSLVAKRSLLYYTLRKKDSRNTLSLNYFQGDDEYKNNMMEPEVSDSEFTKSPTYAVEMINTKLRSHFEKNYSGKYLEAFDFYIDYLKRVKYYNKRDFGREFDKHSFGYSLRSGHYYHFTNSKNYRRKFQKLLNTQLNRIKDQLYAHSSDD